MSKNTTPGGGTTKTPGQTDRMAAALALAEAATPGGTGLTLDDLHNLDGIEEAPRPIREAIRAGSITTTEEARDAIHAEAIHTMDEKEARQVTDCIKAADGLLWSVLAQAFNGRAWIALGYPSWDAYCDGELSTTRLKIPRLERQEIVQSLRDSGMTYREIGSTLGINHQTVANDLSKNRQPVSEPEVTVTPIRNEPPAPPVIEAEVVDVEDNTPTWVALNTFSFEFADDDQGPTLHIEVMDSNYRFGRTKLPLAEALSGKRFDPTVTSDMYGEMAEQLETHLSLITSAVGWLKKKAAQ